MAGEPELVEELRSRILREERPFFVGAVLGALIGMALHLVTHQSGTHRIIFVVGMPLGLIVMYRLYMRLRLRSLLAERIELERMVEAARKLHGLQLETSTHSVADPIPQDIAMELAAKTIRAATLHRTTSSLAEPVGKTSDS